MNLTETLILFSVILPLAVMPSSSVVLVVARTVSAGQVSGAFATLGIVVGDLIFIALALVGMSILAGWLGIFFTVLKYCGSVYLIWFGLRLLKSESPIIVQVTKNQTTSFMADFTAGLFLTLGDVKAIIFYASLFPALVNMEKIDWWDISLIVLITSISVGGAKLGYVLFSAQIIANFRGQVESKILRKFGGLLIIGCGLVLFATAF